MEQQNKDKKTEKDFHGAAVIDQQGREIPITEAMVKKACEKLEEEQPRSASNKA